MTLEIACVNRALRVAVTEDGQELPVTNMFDGDGDETDDVDAAVTCVAGPDKDGLWLTIDFAEMESVVMQ